MFTKKVSTSTVLRFLTLQDQVRVPSLYVHGNTLTPLRWERLEPRSWPRDLGSDLELRFNGRVEESVSCVTSHVWRVVIWLQGIQVLRSQPWYSIFLFRHLSSLGDDEYGWRRHQRRIPLLSTTTTLGGPVVVDSDTGVITSVYNYYRLL